MVLLDPILPTKHHTKNPQRAGNNPLKNRQETRSRVQLGGAPRYALSASSTIGDSAAVPAGAGGHESVPERGRITGRDVGREGVVRDVPHICNGENGEDLGGELRGVLAGEVGGEWGV